MALLPYPLCVALLLQLRGHRSCSAASGDDTSAGRPTTRQPKTYTARRTSTCAALCQLTREVNDESAHPTARSRRHEFDQGRLSAGDVPGGDRAGFRSRSWRSTGLSDCRPAFHSESLGVPEASLRGRTRVCKLFQRLDLRPQRPMASPGVVFASPEDMRETITAISSRSSLPNQPSGARRVSSTDREPAGSARAQHPAAPTRTLERRPVTETRLTPGISTMVLRIQREYREMPGLKLTEAQARRLWDLDGETCNLVLTTLLDQRFLKYTASGTYVRATD